MMELLTDPQVWILLITLSAIEIVLGIDNLVFISIAVAKLPLEQREFARKFGIAVACITRIGLLLMLAWLAGLTDPLFAVFGRGISVRDLVLILGGLFLIALVIIWLTDKPEPEPVAASEREYTGFEDGFPVPPLPGQTPVASPRATATIEGTLATASALESPKEATDE